MVNDMKETGSLVSAKAKAFEQGRMEPDMREIGSLAREKERGRERRLMATVTTEIGSQTKKKEMECMYTLVEPDFKENGWLANAKAKESTYW